MIDTASNGGLPVPKKICVSRCLDPARPFQSAGLAGRDFVFTPSEQRHGAAIQKVEFHPYLDLVIDWFGRLHVARQLDP
ncbi:hypothetical protein RB213_015017 [Colletotrichum asianum]